MATTKKKLIVLCDGTWCGAEAGTQSNIYLLAKMIMNNQDPYAASPYQDAGRDIRACYFRGVGLGGTFLEYLFNGATGSDIGQDCLDVYKYIVQHFTEDREIWMFGLSRGAYTVRCVAGMINNCGILMRRRNGHVAPTNDNADLTEEEEALCGEVYKVYRSRDPEDSPKSPRILRFKARVSYNVRTPVKFMGLFDTVGSLGIPKLDAGIGLTFPEFYDQKVSSVVEKVYHALSIHDRLWCFEPCHALRDDKHISDPTLDVQERWFPGCHYDLGRQRFRFMRNGQSWLERTADAIINPLSGVIEPNHVLAAFVLRWMLERIQQESGTSVISHIQDRFDELNGTITAGAATGDGDVYRNILDYGPFGKIWEQLVNPTLSARPLEPITVISQELLNNTINLLGPIGQNLQQVINGILDIVNNIINIIQQIPIVGRVIQLPGNLANDIFGLFAPIGIVWRDSANMFLSLFQFHEFRIIIDVLAQTRERRISGDADVARYDSPRSTLNNTTIADRGQINDTRYPSKAYDNFARFTTVMGYQVHDSSPN